MALMNNISAARFEQICDGVWRDRATILADRGFLSGEDALIRAVYWRLYKIGADLGASRDAHATVVNALIQHYRDEFGKNH